MWMSIIHRQHTTYKVSKSAHDQTYDKSTYAMVLNL